MHVMQFYNMTNRILDPPIMCPCPPQIDFDSGYIGDGFPLCSDLPSKHFLKINAKYRLLGGDPRPLWHWEDKTWYNDPEIKRFALDSNSALYNELCQPKNNPPLPSSSGTGSASYSGGFGAPYCQGSYISCDSNTLLEGRGASESDFPNTIDTPSCQDGADTTHEDSVKKIAVESAKGNAFRGGELVHIKATVIAYNTADQVDFYYTSDAANPNWVFITTVNAKAGLHNVIVPFPDYPDISYTLPKCSNSAGCQQVSFTMVPSWLIFNLVLYCFNKCNVQSSWQ